MGGLDLSRLDLGAMAAAAGQGIGNMGLDVADWGVYGRNFAAAQAEQQRIGALYAQMENQKQLQAMQQQGSMEELAQRGQQALGLAQQQNTFQGGQNELDRAQQMQQAQMQQAIRQQELEQQGKYQQGQLGVAQGNLELNKEQLGVDSAYKAGQLKMDQEKEMHDKYFKTFEAMQKLDDKEKERISSYAGVVSIIAKNKPEALGSAIDYGAANGIFPAEMAEQLKGLPPELVQAEAIKLASAGAHAIEWAKLSYPEKKGASAGETIISPDGTITIGAQKKVQADAQQQIVDTLKNANSLEQIVSSFDPSYLTMSGDVKDAAGKTLSYLGLAGETEDYIKQLTGGKVDPVLLKKFSEDRAEFTSQVATFKMNFIKAMSGLSYTDKQMSAMEDAIMTEEDSPSAFVGKARGLAKMFNVTLKTLQQVTDNGIPKGTPEFQKAFDDRLQKNIVGELESKNLPGVMVPKVGWVTGDQIKAYAKDKKISVREALEKNGVFQ